MEATATSELVTSSHPGSHAQRWRLRRANGVSAVECSLRELTAPRVMPFRAIARLPVVGSIGASWLTLRVTFSLLRNELNAGVSGYKKSGAPANAGKCPACSLASGRCDPPRRPVKNFIVKHPRPQLTQKLPAVSFVASTQEGGLSFIPANE